MHEGAQCDMHVGVRRAVHDEDDVRAELYDIKKENSSFIPRCFDVV